MSPADHDIQTLIRTVDAVEAAAMTIATGYDGRIPCRVVSALREAVAIARVRAEDTAIEAGVDLVLARTPDAPELDPYEGWGDYEIVVADRTVTIRTKPEDIEFLVATLQNGEDAQGLDRDLKRAQLELALARLAAMARRGNR